MSDWLFTSLLFLFVSATFGLIRGMMDRPTPFLDWITLGTGLLGLIILIMGLI